VSLVPLRRRVARTQKARCDSNGTVIRGLGFSERGSPISILFFRNVPQNFSNSRSLGIPHETLQIPWGSPPYTAKPSSDQSFERIARYARYTLLLSSMYQHEADAIAFGHQVDDQLETFSTKLVNGTGFLGLGGMKSVRRFGMGDGSPGRIGWYVVDGMGRWIIRPLLGFSKVRSLIVRIRVRAERLRTYRIECSRRVTSTGWIT
jgi:hypothetical protein